MYEDFEDTIRILIKFQIEISIQLKKLAHRISSRQEGKSCYLGFIVYITPQYSIWKLLVKPRREDEQLGELHANSSDQDSNQGPESSGQTH